MRSSACCSRSWTRASASATSYESSKSYPNARESTKDTEQIVEAVRTSLGPAISAAHARDGKLPVLTLEPIIEHSLAEALRVGDHGTFLAARSASRRAAGNRCRARSAQEAEMKGIEPVLVCSTQLRAALHRLLHGAAPRLPVLAYTELGAQLELETIAVVNLGQPATV